MILIPEDDGHVFNGMMREGETLALAFMRRMEDIGASHGEGIGILSAFVATVLATLQEGDEADVAFMMRKIGFMVEQLVPDMCRLWRETFEERRHG